jgi:hypothetical protein
MRSPSSVYNLCVCGGGGEEGRGREGEKEEEGRRGGEGKETERRGEQRERREEYSI